jgi:quercetin dioxygenase-like cupin family protein
MSKTTRSISGPSKSSGEASSETHEFDLGAIFPVLFTHVLRSRYVDVAPGGTVLVHSHESCPSFYLILEGELEVHRSDRGAPERLRANDTTKVAQGVAHWWRNRAKGPGRLLVTDLRPKDGDAAAPGSSQLPLDPAFEAGAQAEAEDRGPPAGLPKQVISSFEGPAVDIDEINILIDETPLAAEFPNTEGIKDLWMRARWIDVGVDGIVPLHDHRRRPNILRVMTGVLTFHGPRGMQAYPAGSLMLEAGPKPHWWENRGRKPVRLYAVDIYDRAARE